MTNEKKAKSTKSAKPGDKILIKTKNKEAEGVLIQSPDKDVTIIKLDSGYNMGISKKEIKSIKVLEKLKSSKESSAPKVKQNKSLPTISILHTGGTIASKVDYKTGGVIAKFTPEEILAMFPELKNVANINSRLIRNMWSEDMRFAHYNLMAKEIQKEIKKGVDGIIITHGTDTMHYTSAALSFILENLPVPVILVGAQRSSDRGSSDAFSNLTSAAEFISKIDYAEVGVCMHYKSGDDVCAVLPGLKTRKMHTSRRDAFQPINVPPIALINTKTKKIEILTKDYTKKDKNKKLNLKLMNEKLKIGLLKIHPNMHSSEFSAYENFDGLVLEGTGLGQAPIEELDEFTKEHVKIKNQLKKLCSKIPVVMSPQTIYGRINMNVYSKGREVQKLGVLGNLSDMTPETAYIKLVWLLSNYKKSEIKDLISKNLKGEITECISEKDFVE